MTMRSWPRLAAALLAITAGLYALGVALTGSVALGDVGEWGHGKVGHVAPDSMLWDAGLREGQAILWSRDGSQRGGWAVQTAEANGGAVIYGGAAELFLRASATFALVGVALGMLALPAARAPAKRAELLASLGIVAATVPIAVAYDRGAGLLVIGAAAIGPWAWFARWGGLPRQLARAGLVVAAGLWLAWLLLRLADPVLAVALRNTVGAWVAASAIVLVVAGARVTPRRVADTMATIQVLDVLVVGGAILLGVVLLSLGVSLLLIVPVILLPLILLIGTRRQLLHSLDRVLLAELRERAAIRATEEERARVSREIHDDPLQQITGVIRELEGEDPDASAATASLRDVAAKLRGVATELRPPALDDLGLVPAIHGLARQTAQPPIDVAVENQAGYVRAKRPPEDVELAAFRIVQEAVGNAVRHAAASTVRISGHVAPDGIELVVADDGRGIDDEAVDTAQRDGHMGLASMRGRATAIGAELRVEPLPDRGTAVTLRWHP